ncbi:MAG: hypothetical protein ACJA2S_005677 [Cyclobacteriaceae bacterium]|jgi:hypothetical protein
MLIDCYTIGTLICQSPSICPQCSMDISPVRQAWIFIIEASTYLEFKTIAELCSIWLSTQPIPIDQPSRHPEELLSPRLMIT